MVRIVVLFEEASMRGKSHWKFVTDILASFIDPILLILQKITFFILVHIWKYANKIIFRSITHQVTSMRQDLYFLMNVKRMLLLWRKRKNIGMGSWWSHSKLYWILLRPHPLKNKHVRLTNSETMLGANNNEKNNVMRGQ